MKKLSFQWLITLLTAALVTITCVVLSFAISHFAVMQFDQIGNYTIDLTPFGAGNATVGFDVSQIAPQISAQLNDAKEAFIYQSAVGAFLVVVAAIIVTYFLAGRMLAPLRRITSQMSEIEAQNLSQPLEEPERVDEIYAMVHSFNGMLSRLEVAFAAQRQFSANAAHELRTPLAVMRTKLEVLRRREGVSAVQYEDVVRTVSEQTERLSRVVELLMEMTELQTVERSDRVALHALVEEVFCDLAEIADAKDISLSQSAGDGELTGSDALLYRAIYNLVENGIKYGKTHGAVTVEIRNEGAVVLIAVSDTGYGIDPAMWDDLFAPFFRADGSRSRKMGGAGLGLALVKEIAEVHGGSVRVASSSPEGTTLELALPRS